MNFASYSIGDMVVETTCYPEARKRMFFGLKENGRPFFKDQSNNKDTPYYSINVEGENYKKFEAVGLIIKLNNNGNNGKEYFFSISKLECNAELFDFDNNKVYTKLVNSFTTLFNTNTLRNALMPLSNSNSENYYIFGFSSLFPNKFRLQKHKFNSLNNFSTDKTYTDKMVETDQESYGNQISCFLTVKKLVICFYLTKNNNDISFNIVKYNENLQDKKELVFPSYLNYDTTFLKCIHLKGEIGVYAYYLYKNNFFYPVFLFKEFTTSFVDYLPSYEISNHRFLNNSLINDLIKLTESKIVFSTVTEDKKIVYIILIDIFGDKKIRLRYYPLKLYESHHLKVLFDLRVHNYNNFITLGLSLCPTDQCIGDNDEHYSTLMIFNYPNSTDQTLYLDKYLYNNNNITIDNIEIDLKEYLNFENNIFGFIFLRTFIKNITGCGEYKFFLSTNEEVEIQKGGNLEGDEKMKIKYKGRDIFFPLLSDCQIEYSFIATEPDLSNYDLYPESKEGENDSDFFENLNYTGRSSYYNIKLTEELSPECQDINCDLCYKNERDYCITCKYNFYIPENSENSFKQCFTPETDLITEQTTEALSEGKTESLTERITNIFTEKKSFLTNKIIEYSTEKITEISNQKSTEIITQTPTKIFNEQTTEILTQNENIFL
jgi:hypothetical protein